MNNAKYAVVIGSHNPPMQLLFNTLRTLSSNPNIHIYIIDSSPEDALTKINNQIKALNGEIKFFKVPNYGIGHNFNFGISKAIQENCDLITIFTDDVKILPDADFKAEEITDFFRKHCNAAKDVLVLPQNRSQLQAEIKSTVDSGMTFSKMLFRKVRFNEALVLDQIDFDFSRQVVANGGKFVVYPKILIDVLPVGRETRNQEHILPTWRLYLLTRNAIFIGLESQGKLKALREEAFPQIYHWAWSGIRARQNVLGVFRAVFGVYRWLISKSWVLQVTCNAVWKPIQ